ncbi:MAG: Cytidylate kinase [Candidatus Moranbacteria bacterium GW2011_GWA2_39_41]|nr:MAG: Cytidylate kinase [Candidatus Moranbacteria bacterium GW2011_GWA2_39_41]
MRKDIIISLNGQEGSGKSTIATMLSEKLNIPRFYMGQIFREMAAEQGMTLPEFRKVCDQDPSADKKIDDYVIALPEKNPNFVIESRTAWHFIPQSIKIYLQVDSKIAAERIFKNLSEKNNRGNEDATLDCVENIEQSILKRRAEDSERYFSFYGIRQDEASNYDLVVNTTNLTIEQVFEKVIKYVNEKSS